MVVHREVVQEIQQHVVSTDRTNNIEPSEERVQRQMCRKPECRKNEGQKMTYIDGGKRALLYTIKSRSAEGRSSRVGLTVHIRQ